MNRRRNQEVPIEDFYAVKVGAVWRHFKSESFAFWMICGYLFTEYVRPQSIMPALDFLPWAQVFVLGTLAGWFFEKEKTWVSSPINKLLILYFIVMLLSSWQAYKPHIAYENLANYYLWLIIYFLIINTVTTQKRFLIFIAIFLLASFKISLSLALTWAQRGFSFTSWGLMGPPGFFQNSGELAIQMAVYWPIALAVAVTFKPYVNRWMYYVLMAMPVTAGMVILGASSRGGQLAMAVQLLIKYYRRLFNFKVLLSLVVVASLSWWLLPEEQKLRFTEAGQDDTSRQRLLYWENGWEMMKDHPWLGVGHFNFPRYFEDYYPEDVIFFRGVELAHNIFIQVGADLGFTGLAIYLMLILVSIKMALNMRKQCEGRDNMLFFYNVAGAMNVSLVGFIVAGQFVSVVYYPFMWIHLAFLVCLKNVVDKSIEPGKIEK